MPELGIKYFFLTNDKIMIRLRKLIICAYALFSRFKMNLKIQISTLRRNFFVLGFKKGYNDQYQPKC